MAEIFPVKWYVRAVYNAKHGVAFSVGICGRMNAPAFLVVHAGDGSAEEIIDLTDTVRIRRGKCSDAAWCFFTDCSLNKVEAGLLGFSREWITALKEWLEIVQSRLEESVAPTSARIILFEKPLIVYGNEQ